MGLQLNDNQKTAATLRKDSILVSAAAGSGKTRVLIERLLGFLETEHIERFLIVTYTRAAAGELRHRLSARLAELRAGGDRRAGSELLRLKLAQIGTIHSFCATLLRKYPVEAGVSPNFTTLEGKESEVLRRKALDIALDELYLGAQPQFLTLAETMSHTGRDERLANVLLRLYGVIRSLPEPMTWLNSQIELLNKVKSADSSLWGQYLLQFAHNKLSFSVKKMSEIVDKMGDHKYRETFEKDLENAVNLSVCDNFVAFEAELRSVKFSRLPPTRNGGSDEAYFKSVRDEFKKLIEDLSAIFLNQNMQFPDDIDNILPIFEGIEIALKTFDRHYSALKERKNVLDFSDLEQKARDLLQNRQIAESLGFVEVLVDEYQDVNRVQEEILQRLHVGGSSLFMVGDVRQSIYGFRHADPQIFLEKYNSYAKNTSSDERHARVTLVENYRSHPKILDAVNAVFSCISNDYAEQEKLTSGNLSTDSLSLDKVPRACLIDCLNRSEAESVAAICSRLIRENGVSPSEIAVLTRTSKSIKNIANSLENLNISACCGENKLLETPEAICLISVLRVLENPRQDLPLLTLLRSPIYNFGTNELLAIRRASPDGCLYDSLRAADGRAQTVLEDVKYLRSLTLRANPARLFHGILERFNLEKIFSGENLFALLPHFCAGNSPETCLSALENSDSRLEASGGGVNIITIHRSKGLEFKAVILADAGRRFNETDARKPILFHKDLGLGVKYTDLTHRVQYPTLGRHAVALRLREDLIEEEKRLLYVALTRAEQFLFVVGSKDSPPPADPSNTRCMLDWVRIAAAQSPNDWEREVWDDSSPPGVALAPIAEERVETPEPTAAVQIHAVQSKVTVTQLFGGEDAEEHTFAVPRFLDGKRKMSAAERGTALHNAFRFVDFDVCAELSGAEREVARLAAEWRISPAQAEVVAPQHLTAFAASDLGRRARAAKIVYRERAFTVPRKAFELFEGEKSDDTVLLQGMIDLMFEEDGQWVIVDFKTTAVKGLRVCDVAEKYRPQIEAYAGAARDFSGKDVREGWIWFAGGNVPYQLI